MTAKIAGRGGSRPAAAGRDARPADDGCEIGYITEDGAEPRIPLAEAWAVPFEHGLPARRFTAREGQRHLSGLWWSATTGGHVGFESWLERDHLMLLDFDQLKHFAERPPATLGPAPRARPAPIAAPTGSASSGAAAAPCCTTAT